METRRRATRSSLRSQAQRKGARAKSVPTTSNSVTKRQPTDQISEQKGAMTSPSVGRPSSPTHPALQKTKPCPVSVTRKENLVRRNILDDGREPSGRSLPSPSTSDQMNIHPVHLRRNSQRGSLERDDIASRPRSKNIPSALLGQPLTLNTASISTQEPENKARENGEYIGSSQSLLPGEKNPIYSNALPPRPYHQNYSSRLRTTRPLSSVANPTEAPQSASQIRRSSIPNTAEDTPKLTSRRQRRRLSEPNASDSFTEHMSISVESFNDMKQNLSTFRRLANDYSESIKIRDEKIAELSKELDKAKMTIEFLSRKAQENSNTSLSAPAVKEKNIHTQKSRLFKELSDQKMSFEVSGYFATLFDRMTKFAHIYSTETCCAAWKKLRSSIDWSPNEVVPEDRNIRDWRGRVIALPSFQSCELTSETCAGIIGAPLLDIVKSSSSSSVSINGAFIPLCPYDEASKATMFSSSGAMESNFIGQCALSAVADSQETHLSQDQEKNIFDFAAQSTVLRGRFTSACNQAISTRKKSSKTTFLKSLGYNAILGNTDSPNEALRRDQISEAYSKLFRTLPDGTRDTQFWRLASFDEIKYSGYQQTFPITNNSSSTDILFLNDPSKLAYREFRKFTVKEEDETTIMSVVRLDAFITSFVDSLSEFDVQADVSFPANNSTGSKRKRRAKGGRIPLECTRHFSSLLPLALRVLMSDLYTVLENNEEFKQETRATLLMKENYGNDVRRLTIAFRYPCNGQMYLALTHKAFRENVCDWIGSVHDCYMMHSQSLNCSFQLFKESDSLLPMDSDDEQDEKLVTPSISNDIHGFSVGEGNMSSQDED